jgi:peptide/nickel transport system substrate-binding protein
MKRRTLLAGLGAAASVSLARPALVRAASATTLKFIPQIDLSFLDPHWTPAYVTRNHGYMVFDTLYGQDGSFAPQPQMVEGHTIDADGKLWTLTLRDGLVWHDGERVLARDCVASIRRWSKRDAFGDALMQATDQLDAPDDRTIRFRLKHPFPLLPDALGKAASYMPAMMPERLANTDSATQVTEMIGSGPFRYKADERLQGSRNVYEKFNKYVPRASGTPDWTAGPKIVHYERVEWTTIPDSATAAGALQSGEQDWWEFAVHDLLPLLHGDRNIQVRVPDRTGMIEMMRPNHLQPPFNNPAIRRALWGALDQADFMQAIVGTDPAMYHTPLGFFCPGSPMGSDTGLAPLTGKRDYDKVKQELKAAGYTGERVVLLVPTDYVQLKAMGDVAADMMKQCGMIVDYVSTDWGTMLQRRTKKTPVDQGGWSCYVTGWAGLDWMNPAGHISLRGTGEAGYPGWFTSTRVESLRADWLAATETAKRRVICEDIQRVCMEEVPFWPLGQFIQPTANRTSVTGFQNGFSTFWSVRPA